MTDPRDDLDQDKVERGMRAAFGRSAPKPDESVLYTIEKLSGAVPRVVLREAIDEEAPVVRPGAPGADRQADPGPRYQVAGELARGGVGVILKARDVDLGRDVAVKLLKTGLEGNDELLQRFIEEAQIGGQLQHPGIVPVYELGLQADQRPFFTMKLVKGQTLAELLNERADPSEDRVRFLTIFKQICDTVAYAHARGVIHRDLKPANVMIGSFGEVQVVDWGFAKILKRGGVEDEERSVEAQEPHQTIVETTRSGSVDTAQSQAGSIMGTPAYMPPEQARGDIDKLDERADVFALGAILCEILTGKPPYTGEGLVAKAAMARLDDARARLDECPDDDLTQLARQCLVAARAARPRNAGLLTERIDAYLSGIEKREQRARADAASARRTRKYALAFGAVVAVALAVAASFWSQAESALDGERRATQEAREASEARTRALRRLRALALANASGAAHGDPERALLLATEAAHVELLPEVVSQLHASLQGAYDCIKLRGHTDRVVSARFSSGGDRIVTASFDGTARLWDLEGNPLTVFRGHEWWVYDARFSPDGTQVLTASRDGTARLWSLRGESIAVCRDQDGAVLDAQFAADGQRIVTFGTDRTVRVWDLDGNQLVQLAGKKFHSVLVAPDGRGLLTLAIDEKLARLWDLDGQLVGVLEGHTNDVYVAQFAPDGDRIATGSSDGTARVWDRDGNHLLTLNGHGRYCRAIRFYPDGDRILTIDFKGLGHVWDLDGNRVGILRGHQSLYPFRGGFSQSGDRIVTAGADPEVRVWDREGKPLAVLKGHDATHLTAAFSPQGNRVLTAGDDTPRLWDLSRREIFTREFEADAWEAVYSPSGKQILTLHLDGCARLWARSGRLLARLGSPRERAGYARAVFSKAGDRILVAHQDDTARLYDLTGKELAAYKSEGSVWHVAFDPSGERVVTGATDGTARVFTLDGEPLTVFRTEGSIHNASFLPSGDRLFVTSGTKDQAGTNHWRTHIVKLDGTVLHELRGRGNLSPLGDRFLRFTGDWSVDLYDTEAEKITQLCEPGTLSHSRVKWSPQGDRLLVVLRSEPRVARVWDLEGNELAVLRGHEAPLVWTVGRFSPSGDRILTHSWDKTARVWDLQGNTITVLRGHTGIVNDASLSPSGDEIVTVAADNTVRTWHARPEDLRDLADRRKPREFTAAERVRYAELLEPVER